ncbi:hypothetical protein J437_LFUL008810 [Ladona fulva]|uniref:C2H2-type domain-containing protein n=1 Tax=Ladona fulva TaxID=123851 RepID=A0A8K0P431_LADFU|nr:hypothetical protein J437_LFUL008810 [Ladona fulva]
MNLLDNADSPQIPNWTKEAKNDSINYKEYHEYERKHNIIKQEIKQEPEEVPEICLPAQVQAIRDSSSEGNCRSRKRRRTVPEILEEELKVRLAMMEEEKEQKMQQHAAKMKICKMNQEIAEKNYKLAVMKNKLAEARLRLLLTEVGKEQSCHQLLKCILPSLHSLEQLDSLRYADKYGKELAINYKEYHGAETRDITMKNEIKEEMKEAKNWAEEERNCCVDIRNGLSDLRRVRIVYKVVENRIMESEKEDMEGEKNEVRMETETVDKVEDVSCHHCGEKRKTKHQLKKHIYSQHMSLLAGKESKVDYRDCRKKRYKCTLCHKEFKRKINLLKHVKIHTGGKTFNCCYCEYRTSNSSSLSDHIRTHPVNMPFECQICEYCTSTKGDLKKHVVKHSSEKPFQCNYCEFSTKDRRSLSIHTRRHTGEKPFECSYCEYSTSNNKCLTTHIRIHTDDLSYSTITREELHHALDEESASRWEMVKKKRNCTQRHRLLLLGECSLLFCMLHYLSLNRKPLTTTDIIHIFASSVTSICLVSKMQILFLSRGAPVNKTSLPQPPTSSQLSACNSIATSAGVPLRSSEQLPRETKDWMRTHLPVREEELRADGETGSLLADLRCEGEAVDDWKHCSDKEVSRAVGHVSGQDATVSPA